MITPYPKALEAFPVLRQSTLSRFDECGLASLFERNYRSIFDDGSSGRGIIWHRAAARFLREMAATGNDHIEVDVAIAILMETLRQADVPIEEVVNIPMREVHDLLWMTKKFAYETRWNIAALVDVEQRLEHTVRYPNPNGGWVERVISGQLDALFAEGEALDHGIIPDWKTGWWLPPASEVSEQGFFQQKFYGLLAMRNHLTLNRVTLREFYPRYSQPREATIYRDQLDNIEDEIAALVERFDRSVQEDVWHPSPGAHCSYCPRPTACPIFPTAKRRGRISSAEEASTVAAQVLVAEKAIKGLKEQLKVWTGEHGPIPVRDAKANRVWGHRVSRRVDRPTREQMERAIQTGETLDDLYRETIGTRFDIHIPRPEIEPEPEPDLTEQLQRSIALAEERKRRNG
ncbi:MAG: PD-(D/E)XK nuclease family protein [Acidimicrobiaceae bacterium]|nr:PD-(D/E)XK nuclease family protein [Acidimicrobiaceae bacterium]